MGAAYISSSASPPLRALPGRPAAVPHVLTLKNAVGSQEALRQRRSSHGQASSRSRGTELCHGMRLAVIRRPCSAPLHQQRSAASWVHPVATLDRAPGPASQECSHGHPVVQQPRQSARFLTTQLSCACTPEELMQQCMQAGDMLNHIHLTAALVRLAKLSQEQRRQQQQQQQQQHNHYQQHQQRQSVEGQQQQQQQQHAAWLLGRLLLKLPNCGTREVANTLWALASLGYVPPPAQLDALLDRTCRAFARAQQGAAGSWQGAAGSWQAAGGGADERPRQAAMIMWALAVLELQPGEELQQVLMAAAVVSPGSGDCAQTVANLLWAAAKLGMQPSVSWLEQLLAWLRAGGITRPQTAANVLWACAVILARQQPQPSSRRRRQGGAQLGGDGQLLALAACGAAAAAGGGSLLASLEWVVRQAQPLLGEASPQELSNMLWACGKLGLSPSAAWASAYWQSSAPQLAAARPQELSSMLHGAARCRLPPPLDWQAGYMAAVAQAWPRFGTAELAPLLWAVAALNWRPPSTWVDAALGALVAQLPTGCAPGHVSMAVWAMAKMGYRPPWPTMAALLAAVKEQLPQYGCHALVHLLWGAAVLGCQPRRHFRGELLAAVLAQVEQLNSHQLATLLYALTKLQGAPVASPQQAWQEQQLLRNRRAWEQEWRSEGEEGAEVPPYPPQSGSARRRRAFLDPERRQRARHGGAAAHEARAPPAGASPVLRPRELAALLARAEQLLPTMGPQELTKSLLAAVWLGADLGSPTGQGLLRALRPQLLLLGPSDSAVLLWSLGRTAAASAPSEGFMLEVLRATQPLLLRMSPLELALCLWGLDKLHARPPAQWAAAALDVWSTQLPSLSPWLLGTTLSAMARLGMQPAPAALAEATRMAEASCAQFDSRDNGMIFCSLAKLQERQERQAEEAAVRQRRAAAAAMATAAAAQPVPPSGLATASSGRPAAYMSPAPMLAPGGSADVSELLQHAAGEEVLLVPRHGGQLSDTAWQLLIKF